MAVSKAHIKASNKYNKENYKKIQANIKPADFAIIEDYCKDTGLSKATVIVNAIKYCIENDIDLK
ncbi:MAG: hypothetical protein IJ416_11605 [Ruminiclostridium sp.]|nr:hypothetical protein [Ruminiclostridium sp.]